MASGFIAIGSGPAGLTAAETFRRQHPKIPVRILSSDPCLPYAKPHLSKSYLRGSDPKLDLRDSSWFVQNGIQLDRGITVDHVDLDNREVVTAAGRRYSYWHLVLAQGASPVGLDVPGAESALPLRSFSDAVVLRMAARTAESAVVIGGGLIGCEAATSLATRGVVTTLVAAEAVPVLRRFGPDAGERVAKLLSDSDVRFIGNVNVVGIGDGDVSLDDGSVLQSDLVVSAIGVQPDSRLAADAGIDVAEGRIVVNAQMHTSAPNVYAAGDVALAYNLTAERRIRSEHWRDATEQGRIAGAVAAGYSASWTTVPEFSCFIGNSKLTYRGWGTDFDRASVLDTRDGFSVTYRSDDRIVGSLTVTASRGV